MLKFVIFGSFTLAVASAVNLYDLDNFIEYEDVPLQGIHLPYPYQDNRIRFVEPERFAERYEPVVVSVPGTQVTDVVLPKPGFFSTIASTMWSLTAFVSNYCIKNIIGLIVGSLSAIGVCTFTSICNKLTAISSFSEASRDFSTIITPERLARATEFMTEAIKKYRSLQNK